VRVVWVKVMKEGTGSAAFRKTESITECPSGSEFDGNVIVLETPKITVSSTRGVLKEGGLLIPVNVKACW
jgi:hypothetical protein